MVSSSKRMIVLESSDGKIFVVEDSVMVEWRSMDHLLKIDRSSHDPIWFPSITGDILAMVIDFSKKHADDSASSSVAGPGHSENIYAWDTNFVKVSKKTLADLIVAAQYIGFQKLLDLTCGTMEEMNKELKAVEEGLTAMSIEK
ncbi:hypothetical protein FNV43_RR21877 [Rhamnella rubrinervis]|uniref:SKP1-like protein n=1 Tax=Rhamnella rubrinervis TaxID=2594499 RepID=A0A8K0DU21_9ROSA|nr:hypothetical protein FNV43_RR21877 [Rhamnella rubrinervis]